MVEKTPVAVAVSFESSFLLDQLCDLFACSREAMVGQLIGQEYERCKHMSTQACPWHISDSAIRDYLAIAGNDDREGARIALEAAAIDAITSEREGQRKPAPQQNGALRYRGPKPRRLVLYVQPTTKPPTLVAVSAGGRSA
jgi:hypothetical protein